MDRAGWPLAFALTLLVEVPAYVLALRRRVRAPLALLAALALNAATHPLVWPHLTAVRAPLQPGPFVALEAAVVIVEAAGVYALGRLTRAAPPIDAAEALAIALVANALSAGLGLLA